MANVYSVRPSEILGIVDDYTSYCFDEACALIISKMKNNEKPVFKKKDKDTIAVQHFSKMSDLYKNMGFEYGQYVKQMR